MGSSTPVIELDKLSSYFWFKLLKSPYCPPANELRASPTPSPIKLPTFNNSFKYSENLLISYPKFKRKINEGYSIKDAVCFGKYLSEEEYSIFVNEIGNIY